MTTKVCSKCGEEKDISEFYTASNICKPCKTAHHKQYYKDNCEKLKEKQRARNENNRDRIKAYNKKYTELHREHLKEQSKKYYEENRESQLLNRRKYRIENREQIIENRKLHYQENKEEIKEERRKYRREHPEKTNASARRSYYKNIERIRAWRRTDAGIMASAHGHHNRRVRLLKTPCTLTLLQWKKILETQGNKCAICGKRFCKSRPPTKDHIIPLSKGGGLTFENVQALCRSCNSSKCAALDHTKIITWSHNGITT